MIKSKNFFYIIFLIIVNYFLITALVFSFSYMSILQGKTYDWFWVKSIQKKIYFRGLRNIWQYNKNCNSYDENLLYKPKIGICEFSNPEFDSSLKFDEYTRVHEAIKEIDDLKDFYVVLGDSIAMGWGVNDNETFAFQLEKLLQRKVYNMAVSSYGTVREIKKLKLSPYYKNSKTIIIQYHPNDLGENRELDINKTYTKNNFEKIFANENIKLNNFKFIFRNYKSSIRLFFSDIIDIVFRSKNLELINFDNDKKYLEKVLKENINLNEKKVIVFMAIQPWQKVINFPKNNENIEYILIELNKSHFFNIDDHPNQKGHLKIAKILNEFLSKNISDGK